MAASESFGGARGDFIKDRLSRLVRQALEEQRISLGRAAEILGLSRDEMWARAHEWTG